MNETQIAETTVPSGIFRISPMTLFMAALIPCCAMLMLPGLTFGFTGWNVHFFNTGAVVLLAGACLCFVPERLFAVLKALPVYASASLGILFLTGLYHVIRHPGTYQIQDIGMCFLYTALPVFGMVFRRELLKLLPWLFSLFWLLNLITNVIQNPGFSLHRNGGGIPGNINWNASFTLITGAVTIFFIFTKIRPIRIRIAAAALVILPSLYIEACCSSRGALLASLCAFVVFLRLRMKTPRAKTCFRIGIILLFALIVFGVLAFLKSERGRTYFSEDDRVFFAATVPDMILEAPILGYGAPSFEQAYLPWRNAGFFQLPYATDRVNHPHNDILFTAAGYGITGLICWLILCFTPVIRLIQGKTGSSEPLSRLLFFLFLALLIHAQLDLIFFHIPLAAFSTLILGILWGELHSPEMETVPAAASPFHPRRVLSACAGTILAICGLFSALANLTAYQILWLGEREISQAHEVTPTAAKCLRSLTKLPEVPPHVLSAAAADSFADGVFRPDIIFLACNALKKTPVPDYGHMNLLKARALEEEGKLAEAEIYYLRENELFPLMILPLGHLLRVYSKMNNEAKFLEAERAIRELMPRKGIDERDIPVIIENPGYDMRPWNIPGKKYQNGKAVPVDDASPSGQN